MTQTHGIESDGGGWQTSCSPPGAVTPDLVAYIRRIIVSLADESVRLRSQGAEPAVLAANSLAIEYWQRQLARRSGTGRQECRSPIRRTAGR